MRVLVYKGKTNAPNCNNTGQHHPTTCWVWLGMVGCVKNLVGSYKQLFNVGVSSAQLGVETHLTCWPYIVGCCWQLLAVVGCSRFIYQLDVETQLTCWPKSVGRCWLLLAVASCSRTQLGVETYLTCWPDSVGCCWQLLAVVGCSCFICPTRCSNAPNMLTRQCLVLFANDV